MTISYRRAEAGDAAALKALFAQSFAEAFGHLYPPADLQEFLHANSEETWRVTLSDPEVAIRLAEEEGAVVGFVELAPKKLPYETSAPVLELRRLYLTSGAHGRGIADALMNWAISEAHRRGAKELVLSVYIDNLRARRFYDRYGFDAVGRYDFKVGSCTDEDLILRHIIMQPNA